MVVRRIKTGKRRGDLKLAVFSYRKPNPWLLIPSYQSLVTSYSSLLSNLWWQLCRRINNGDARKSLDSKLLSYRQPSPRGEGAP